MRGWSIVRNSCYVSINLKVFKNNYNIVKNKAGKQVEIIPVLKADAYGHGMVEIAKAALESGCIRVAVSRLEEAIELRKAGIDCEIIILYQVLPENIKELYFYELTPSISNKFFLEELIEFAALHGKKINVHIAIDVGTGSLGITLQNVLWNNRYLNVLGLFTHFVSAYSDSDPVFYSQKNVFDRCIKMIPKNKRSGVTVHAASSPSFIKYDNVCYDAVRLATLLYGIPLPNCNPLPGIESIVEIKSTVSDIKKINTGKTITGYSISYCPCTDTSIAIVSAGYGDFWWLNQSRSTCVLIGGKRAKIIGTPYMDRMLIDTTDIENVNIGDEVILLGRQGKEEITIEEICKRHNINIASAETVVFSSSRVAREFYDIFDFKADQNILQGLRQL